MLVLAIDTAGPACNVALHDAAADVTLAMAGADIGRGHAELLMGFIDEALIIAGKALADVDRIAVTIGPGSFTGIRVGVATARGLALTLGVPAVGVSVLRSLAIAAAAAAPGRPVLVAMDAKRDEVYLQPFGPDGVPLAEPASLEIAAAHAAHGGFWGVLCGSGAPLVRAGAASSSDTADIAMVARLGALADPAAALPKPLYLRGPDVRSQAGFAVARA